MTTTARTDIHRPSSEDFDPEQYEYIAEGDNGGGEDEPPNHPTWAVRELVAKGAHRFGGIDAETQAYSGQCTHCGAHIRYYAILLHVPTQEWIYVGETCLDNRFESESKASFQALRKAAMLNRERRTKAAKIAAIVAEYPFLGELQEAVKADASVGEFLWSINDKLRHYGELSDRQVQAAERAWEGHKKYAAKVAASEALRASEIAAGTIKPAPQGRVTIEGTVLSLKEQENNFSYHGGTILKALVEATEGYKVWLTVPAAMIDEVEKGSKIRVTITLKTSQTNDDPYFAIGTRPSGMVKM